MTKYSFTKGLSKALVSILIVGIPVIMDLIPSDVANLTVSGILLMVLNYLKVKGVKLP